MPSPLCVFLLLNGAALADFLVKPRVVASVNYDDYSLLCADGIPLLMEDHRPRPCQPRPWLPEHKCPASFWCHEGDDESSYYCCPKNRKSMNRCHLLPSTGHGNLTMRRFYYDWTSDGCHELHYTGIGGNENSFMTYEECEDACRGAGEPSVNSSEGSKISKNKKITKKPSTTTTTTTATTTKPLSSSISANENANEVEQSTTKLPGSREVTEAEIPLSTTPKAPHEITVEPSTISPFGDFKEPLNSKSAESSHETVKVRILWQDKNPCELPSSAGTPGGVARKMWHFDESLMSCVPFVFLGLGGNANRFSDPESCMRTCGSGRPTRASCELPSQFGNGTFKIPRYYFDKTAKQCELFYYSGDGGNENRFLRKAKCERLCLGKKNKKQSTAAVVTSTMGTRPVTRIFQEFHSSEATTTVPTTTAAPSSTPIRPSSEKSAEVVYVTSTPSHTSPKPSPSTEVAYTSSTEKTTDDPFPTLISIPKEFVPPFPQVTLLPAVSPKGGKFPKTTPEPPHTEEYQFIFEHLLQSTEEPHKSTKIPHVAIPDYLAQLESAEKYADLIASPKWSSQERVNAVSPESTESPVVGQPALLVGSMHVITPEAIKQVQPKPFVQPEPERAKEIQQAKPFVQPEPERAMQIQQPVPFVQPQPALPYVGAPVQNYQSSVPPMFYISNPGIHPAPGSPTAYNYVKSSAMPVDGITPLYGSYLSTHQKPGVTLNPQWIDRGAQAFNQIVEQRVVPTAAPLQSTNTAPVDPTAILLPPKPKDLSASLQKLLQYHTRDKSHSSVNPDLVQPGPSGAQPITKQELTTLNQSSTAVDVSPCHSPLYGDVVIMCVLEDVTCPAGTFCQVGDAQSICCPTLPEPQCDQPLRPGVGPSSLLRWHYEPSTRQCHLFVFRGFQGNQNNFESLEKCESTCRDANPCEEGIPVPSIGESPSCSLSLPQSCPSGTSCKLHGGRGFCCPEPTKSIKHPVSDSVRPECLLPQEAGYGLESSHRWSFDATTSMCVSFIYNGYGGNQNNFLSRNDCETACTPLNPCDQPASSGYGNQFISRFFFSKEYGQCLHFIYSGEGGNLNNFANAHDCVNTCVTNSSHYRSLPTVVEFSIPVVTHPVCPHGEVATNGQTPVKCDAVMGYGCPSGYVCTPTGGDAYCCQAPESFCLQPRPPLSVCLSPDSPPVQRIEFTYDPLADRCIRFSYSSCSPTYNLNHFETDSQCQRLCCNQGYDLVYKRRLMKLNDSPLDISENSDRR